MSYASSTAITRANAIGLNLSLGDWRDIFLAITDEVAADPPTSPSVSASFIGRVRDGGERWHIKAPRREFDVIYDPPLALIVLVMRSNPPASEAQPAILPKPTPPLRGKVAELVA